MCIQLYTSVGRSSVAHGDSVVRLSFEKYGNWVEVGLTYMYVSTSQSIVCEWHQFQGLNVVIYSQYSIAKIFDVCVPGSPGLFLPVSI